MTIVAGFKCYEGIVICADTQETVSNVSKRNVPKLRFKSSEEPHEGDSLAAAFCGAGDNGPFIDKIVETAWEDAQLATGLDEACEEIEKSIKRTYREFGGIYQAGYCPSAELVYGIKMDGNCRLFSAHDAVVNEKETYEAWGAGYYMADFLAARMYGSHLNIRQLAILAAYILFQAKEHVVGCGGDSHIAVLRDRGVSGQATWQSVKAITELLDNADRDLGSLLIDSASTELRSEEFMEKAKNTIEMLDSLRTYKGDYLKEQSAVFMVLAGTEQETDFLGLPLPKQSPTPSASQTEEPEP